MALKGAKSVLATSATFFVEVHVGCGLELLRGSVPALLPYFPATHYDLRIRAEDDESFQDLTSGEHLTRDRFFLLAVKRAI